jgi:hypothetical protein
MADELVHFWSAAPLYRTTNSSPELRFELGTRLRRIGGLQHTLLPSFPREADVLLEARFLDFSTLDPLLRERGAAGLESARALQWLADRGSANRDQQLAVAKALRKCARDLAGLLQDVEDSLGSPPTRVSLRNTASTGAGADIDLTDDATVGG